MENNRELAKRFSDVILNNSWVANNSYKNQLTDLPRIPEVEVAEVNTLDPFSNSTSPLFQVLMPCCIHRGKFSYIIWYRDSTSLAAVDLLARIATVLLELKIV